MVVAKGKKRKAIKPVETENEPKQTEESELGKIKGTEKKKKKRSGAVNLPSKTEGKEDFGAGGKENEPQVQKPESDRTKEPAKKKKRLSAAASLPSKTEGEQDFGAGRKDDEQERIQKSKPSKSKRSAKKKKKLSAATSLPSTTGAEEDSGVGRKEDEPEQAQESRPEKGDEPAKKKKKLSAPVELPPKPEKVEDPGLLNESAEASHSSEDITAVVEKIMGQADKAIDVLLQIADRKKGSMLFPEVDQALDINCVYKKPSSSNPGVLNKKIVLPHAFLSEANTTVCLIMQDLDHSSDARKDPDVDKQARLWEDKLLEEHGITKKHVQKIMTITQFAREYQTFLEKRQLATAYDLFLVDSCVAPIAWNKCGKEFHKKRKLPVRIDFDQGHVVKQIEKARRTIHLPLSGNRTRTSLHIGHLGQKKSEILDNLQETVKCLFNFCPGGLANVRSLYFRISSYGPNLPLYVDAGSANKVRLDEPKRALKEKEEVIEEISTLPEGLEVKVRRDGKIRVVDAATKKTVIYPTVNDEWEERDDIKPLNPEKMAKRKQKKIRASGKLRRKVKRSAEQQRSLKKAFASRVPKKEKA